MWGSVGDLFSCVQGVDVNILILYVIISVIISSAFCRFNKNPTPEYPDAVNVQEVFTVQAGTLR